MVMMEINKENAGGVDCWWWWWCYMVEVEMDLKPNAEILPWLEIGSVVMRKRDKVVWFLGNVTREVKEKKRKRKEKNSQKEGE